jgi:hypothetical protein
VKQHPTEDELELILLAPGDVDVDVRNEIEDHLRRCDTCRDSASLLRSFHNEMHKSPQSLPAVEELVSRLTVSSRVIALHPYRYVPDATEFGTNTMIVLAAKSEAKKEYRYSAVCTLLSRNEETLVRILKDHQTDTYRIYLITKNRDRSNAIIRFPSLDLDVSINGDTQQAEFSLPIDRTGIDWTTIVAELHFS